MKAKNEEKKKKRLVIIFSIFIVLSMTLSIFAILIDNQSNDLTYNTYTFKTTTNGYKVKVNGNYVDFQYFPSELERINLSSEAVNKINGAQAVVFLFDPNVSQDNLVYIDFVRFDMQTKLSKQLIFAQTQASSIYSMPILSCDNATSQVPFIIMNISSDSSITLDNNNPNCIFMNGKLKDIVAVKDRLMYRLVNIMSN